MTLPSLPAMGSTAWFAWASAIHDAAAEVVDGRLSDADLPATIADATPTASTTTPGIVELATTTEATAGTDTARAVTPAGVKAALDARPAALAAALAPLQLKRATVGGTWTDASGTVYDNTARTALRPHPIYWLAAAGAEPTWSTNTYDANTTYGDVVNVVSA